MKPLAFFTILYVLIILFFSFFIATQITAKKLGYPKEKVVLAIGNNIIYSPHYIMKWVYKDAYRFKTNGKIYDKGFNFLYFGCFLSMLPFLFLLRKNKQKNDYIYGDSSWATLKNMKKRKLVNNKDGVILCLSAETITQCTVTNTGTIINFVKIGDFIIDFSNTHIATIAATRTGKGVGTIVPTLCFWQKSVFCYDVKGENFELTSGFRSLFSKVIKLDFLRKESNKWNPLLEIRKDTIFEITDAQFISRQLMNPDGAEPKDPFWLESSIKVFTGLILYLINSSESEKSIRKIYFMLTHNESQEELIDSLKMMASYETGKKEVDDVKKSFLQEFINSSESEKQFVGMLSSITQNLGIFLNPAVGMNTSVSDFSLDDIMNSENPLSVYYVAPPLEMKSINCITRIFIVMYLRKATEKIQNFKHKCLMLIDEFPTIGKIDELEKAPAYVAGYGIKMYYIAQDINQINNIYGNNNSILANCAVQMYYTPNESATADYISKRLGSTTIIAESTSSSGQRDEIFNKNISRSSSMQRKELMTSRQVEEMPYDDCIIFVSGSKPYKGKKNAFYAIDSFKKRATLSPIEMQTQEVEYLSIKSNSQTNIVNKIHKKLESQHERNFGYENEIKENCEENDEKEEFEYDDDKTGELLLKEWMKNE